MEVTDSLVAKQMTQWFDGHSAGYSSTERHEFDTKSIAKNPGPLVDRRNSN